VSRALRKRPEEERGVICIISYQHVTKEGPSASVLENVSFNPWIAKSRRVSKQAWLSLERSLHLYHTIGRGSLDDGFQEQGINLNGPVRR